VWKDRQQDKLMQDEHQQQPAKSDLKCEDDLRLAAFPMASPNPSETHVSSDERDFARMPSSESDERRAEKGIDVPVLRRKEMLQAGLQPRVTQNELLDYGFAGKF
jgi:hypothetical protein